MESVKFVEFMDPALLVWLFLPDLVHCC